MGGNAEFDLQTRITESLYGLFEEVIAKQASHYARSPQARPSRRDVDAIIARAANTNAAVAATANLIPGPLGMVAAVPEILMVLRNQTVMIYDIGVACGQERFMRTELVVGLLESATKGGTTSLLLVQGGKLLVRRASLRVMQKVIVMLGGQITQRVLKSMIGKWLPVVGALAMGAWARFTTKQLGEQAASMLSLTIVEGGVADEPPQLPVGEAAPVSVTFPAPSPPPSAPPPPPVTSSLALPSPVADDPETRVERAKIQTLINLMLADGEAHADEVTMIEGLIRGSRLATWERDRLVADLAHGRRGSVDFSVFANSPDDRMGLLFAMVGLAMRDGKLHLAERLYLKQAGYQLGFSEADVDAALGAEGSSDASPAAVRSRQMLVVVAGVIAFLLVAAAAWSVTRGDRDVRAAPPAAVRP